MSEEWLDIQGFIADDEVMQAITDLSIGLKLELAGVDDQAVREAVPEARSIVERFLRVLASTVEATAQDELYVCDRNERELADAFRLARADQANFASAIVRSGAAAGVGLLAASDRPAKRALIESLEELRRIVSGHQSTKLAAIIEEF
jgi:hypothetical protein